VKISFNEEIIAKSGDFLKDVDKALEITVMK
jgi:hypothetical protein